MESKLTGCHFKMIVVTANNSNINFEVDYENKKRMECAFVNRIETIRGQNTDGDSIILNLNNIVGIKFINLGSPDHHNIAL